MPIKYNPENKGWEAVDLTPEEKQSLVNIGFSFIVDELGKDVADRMFELFSQKQDLQNIPKEEMGSA